MNLFAYGSLIEPEVQARVFGCPRIGEIDWVAGYGLEAVTRDGVQYARAFPKEGGRVRGQRIALSDAELKTADLFEGDAYTRKVVTLESGARAWMYLRPE